MSGTIYWKYDYYRGGLGDFVRGALATYAFCLERSLNFRIWIPDHPLASCFDLEPMQAPNHCTELLIDASNNHGAQLLGGIFDYNPIEELILITNAYNIVSTASLDAAVQGFRELLRPCAAVRDVISRQYDTLKVEGPGTYVSLHVRCGDAFMKDYDRYCPGDARCAPAKAILQVKSAIARIRAETDLPILFHTDSYELRAAISAESLDCKVMTTEIHHTAQHSEGGLGDYYDAVAEFFIVGQAAKVYYTVPSGFTRWSCALHNTPLICLDYSETAIVIQGPIYDFAIDMLCNIISRYPNCIVSTWNTADPSYISQLRSAGAVIVQSDMPNYVGVQNVNLKITSAAAGLKRAEELGYKNAILIRSDMRFVNFDRFINICQNEMDQNKITALKWHYHHVPESANNGYVVDYFHAGKLKNLLQLFSKLQEKNSSYDGIIPEAFLQIAYFGTYILNADAKFKYIIEQLYTANVELYWMSSKHNTTHDLINVLLNG